MSVHDKLNSFIDTQNPKLATFLQHQWKQQQNAITYKELREAIFAGQLDMKYLLQWQQDYSAFVAQYYAPLAEKAIKQAASDLAASYGGAILDPQIGTINSFIQTQGGKLIREISQTQFAAINSLVRQASLTDTMTVDQLARAIRPCVGLTQRQAATTKRYYDNLIEQGYSPKVAQKKQALYAERMHRRRAATIAQTEMAYAYNAGADAVIQQHVKDGYFQPSIKKRWMTAFDERVCPECGKLDGEIVALEAAFSNGKSLPPAHPNCRCAVDYDNIQIVPQAAPQPAQQPAEAPSPESVQQPEQAVPDTYTPPAIPDPPELGDLEYKSSVQLGTGEMHQYTDAEGKEWIFKPAQGKYTGKAEPFRAHVQEAGYKVQSIVDPDSAVPCTTATLDTPNGTKFGAVQLKVENIDHSFNLKEWQNGGANPPKEIITQLQRENVTDWLMCNYDSHGGNFILDDATGTLIGVDKEQAFRYIGNAGAKKMSLTFHPNAAYGETEPIYNTLYRNFASGDIDIDLNDILPYIKRVEAVPDAAYREIFRDYAESLYGKGSKAEHLLDEIVFRKQNLRSTFETFYGDILTQRKGQQTAFHFADDVLAASTQPIQATTMSAKALSGMSLGDLKDVAKKQGIKYAYNMNKSQLIEAISDPSKTQQIVADAKARAYGIGTTPRTPKPSAAATAATGAKAKIDGITQLGEAMDDFDAVLDGADLSGVSLISDKSALEGMQTTLRKITVDGREAYELSGKLTNDRWLQANQDIASAKAGNWQFQPITGTLDYTKPVINFTSSGVQRFSIPTQYIRNGDDILVLTGKECANDSRAMMGKFNIRVFATNGNDAARKVQDLLSRAKLMDVVDDVEPAALDRYKKMRLIWQNDPKLAGKLGANASEQQIQKALNSLGITQARVDSVRIKKVTDGYFTLVDPENVALASKYNVAYLYHEADKADAVVNVLKSGELLSTTSRYERGLFVQGASSGTDITTGGADSVFTRIVYDHDIANGERRYKSFGDYVFVFDKQTLERTDWYAYMSDEFGRTTDSTFFSRLGVESHFQRTSGTYSRSNELLFRRSLPLDTLKEVRVPSAQRKAIIDSLKREGITKLNGIPIEKIIKVGGGTV